MLAAQCHPPCFQPILIDELRRSGFTSRWFCGTSRKMRDWLLWLPNLSFQNSKENLTSACVENSGGFDNLTVTHIKVIAKLQTSEELQMLSPIKIIK